MTDVCAPRTHLKKALRACRVKTEGHVILSERSESKDLSEDNNDLCATKPR